MWKFAVTPGLRDFRVTLEDGDLVHKNAKPQSQPPGAKYEAVWHNLSISVDLVRFRQFHPMTSEMRHLLLSPTNHPASPRTEGAPLVLKSLEHQQKGLFLPQVN